MQLKSMLSCLLPIYPLLLLPICAAGPSVSQNTQVSLTAPLTPTVTAPFGKIVGRRGRYDRSVHEYLGIPYAHPPTGSRRFSPPVRLPNRPANADPIVATKFGLSCPGLPLTFEPYPWTGEEEGEDCLTLNIWTKPGRTNAPVLVWIYGGGFVAGGTDTILYDGTIFARNNDVVIVTVNYRTNVFGFPNAPGLETYNLGLLDQRLALEWIRDNIHSFGGNPDRITLFGESSGGATVDIHAYAWPDDPIVKGLIAQSGNTGLLPVIGAPDNFNAWANLTENVGCAGKRSEVEKLKCMRDLSWRKLVKGLVKMQSCQEAEFLGFGPRMDGKTIFSVEEYRRRGELGLFAKVPLLIGNNNEEIGPGQKLGHALPDCPPPEFGELFSPDVLGKIQTAVYFTCTTLTAARYRIHHQVPTWRYRYYGSSNTGQGAGHSAELPVLFGAAFHRGNLTERDQVFMKYFQSVWTRFAAAPSTGLSSSPFNLPQYNPRKKTLIRLDYEMEVKASTTEPRYYEGVCDILAIPGL
ncbi:Alpha/Beta hydrolase protein [Kalaharituber pfeilii]|nr:Alpha/Beta hydrolase protein [Kalaharituber pfeilii]